MPAAGRSTPGFDRGSACDSRFTLVVASGTRLGAYEVLSPLGEGGMGEVWKARDTRLGRSVAIKLLPAEFAQNEHLRLRLEREARAISQLNHPSICTLHDVGEDGDVMEYVEGETLAGRLERGALPMVEVVTTQSHPPAVLE